MEVSGSFSAHRMPIRGSSIGKRFVRGDRPRSGPARCKARDGGPSGESSLRPRWTGQAAHRGVARQLEGVNDKRAERLYEQALRTQEEASRRQREQRSPGAAADHPGPSIGPRGLLIPTEQPDGEVVERALSIVDIDPGRHPRDSGLRFF
jgi:hypothetical protein